MQKSNSYLVVLDWMHDLGLSCAEMLCYAAIYGFSLDGESEFSGSRRYLARQMCVASLRTVDKALDTLCVAGLVTRREETRNGVTFVTYRATPRDQEPTVGAPAPAAPRSGAKPSYSVQDLLREETPDYTSSEYLQLVATLASEPKWRAKSENAWRQSLRKLASVPEVEACEMLRRTIAGGWQGVFALDARDRAALYGGAQPQPGRPHTTPRRGGVIASEQIAAAALAAYEKMEG